MFGGGWCGDPPARWQALASVPQALNSSGELLFVEQPSFSHTFPGPAGEEQNGNWRVGVWCPNSHGPDHAGEAGVTLPCGQEGREKGNH